MVSQGSIGLLLSSVCYPVGATPPIDRVFWITSDEILLSLVTYPRQILFQPRTVSGYVQLGHLFHLLCL